MWVETERGRSECEVSYKNRHIVKDAFFGKGSCWSQRRNCGTQ